VSSASTGGDPGTGGGDDGLPPTGDNSVAYTGCSMANNIGTGYKRVGGKIMWNADNYQTGAMVVQNWTSPNSSSWQLFDRKMESIGGKDVVKAIMVQICILSQRATDKELRDMVGTAGDRGGVELRGLRGQRAQVLSVVEASDLYGNR
jgi:hypothetical protein